MFYFDFLNFLYFGSTFRFSFLDYDGNTEYDFKGEIDSQFCSRNIYNFITMPVRVPNLKYLTVDFDVLSTIGNPQKSMSLKFGQMNIFSSKDINPVPPNSPFNLIMNELFDMIFLVNCVMLLDDYFMVLLVRFYQLNH